MKLKGKYSAAKVFTDLIEETAVEQVQGMLDHKITKNAKVRIMPDVHAGKGSTIGTTIKLAEDFANWKVCPNVVGVDVGCFTGDTNVQLADGRLLSFLELIEEDKKGIINYCYSIDEEDNIQISKISKPRKIKSVKELYHVRLDNGEIIKATGDHIFHLRNGEKVEAKDLSKGSSLMPLYINKANRVEKELNSKVRRKLKVFSEYNAVYNPASDDYILCHHLSDLYNERHGIEDINKEYYDEKKKGFVRHHIDFNKYNNNPDNIKRMGYLAHWKYHSEMARTTNKLGITGFKRAAELNPNFWSEAGKARAEATWNGPNAEKNYKDKKELMAKLNAEGLVNTEQQRAESRQRQLENNTTKFSTQNKKAEFILKQQVSKYIKIVRECNAKYGEINKDNWNEVRKVAGKNAPMYETAMNKLRENNLSVSELEGWLEDNIVNHRVISIEKVIYDNPVSVYCLTNFEYGNFALSAGVFVNNCGILMYKIDADKVDLEKLDNKVNTLIPSGFNIHNKAQDLEFTKEMVDKLTIENLGNTDRIHKSLGTLGGGNHFIELGVDEDGNYWLSVHSGSRNLGVQVANSHQDKAIQNLVSQQVDITKVINDLKAAGRHSEIQDAIKDIKETASKLTRKDKDLAFLEGQDLKDYLSDMTLAQEYAARSRAKMLDIIVEEMGWTVVDKFDSVHNFIEHDNYTNGVVRKGATSAKEGERLVIPLNMRDGSLICTGKGNKDWNESAPHGAGRMMSRSQARKEINIDTFTKQMSDVYSSSVMEETIDEAPDAYKPAESIIRNIKDTAEITHIVRPVYNFKAH